MVTIITTVITVLFLEQTGYSGSLTYKAVCRNDPATMGMININVEYIWEQ